LDVQKFEFAEFSSEMCQKGWVNWAGFWNLLLHFVRSCNFCFFLSLQQLLREICCQQRAWRLKVLMIQTAWPQLNHCLMV